MLRGREHGHIHSDFRNNANCGKGLDTRHRHNKIELWKILLSSCKNQRFQICLAKLKRIHVGTNNAEFFGLLRADFTIYSGKHLFIGCFHAFGTVRRNIRNLFGWIIEQTRSDCGRGFAKDIRKNIVQLNIGNSQTVLRTVLLTSGNVCKLPTVAHQIPKLANIRGRDKAAGNKVVLKDVRNPLCILLVGFLAANCFDIFRVCQNNFAGLALRHCKLESSISL